MSRCTSPLLAVWYQPDVPADADLVRMDAPRIIGRYSDAYAGRTPAEALGLPLWQDQFLRYVLLPCGKCDCCRLSKSAEWVYRCRMEQLYHPASCFLTLTVDDAHMAEIFPGASLQYPPFQAFFKRLRARISPIEVRYLMCGEYGTLSQRPHYHCLLFGYDFPDRELWRVRDGFPVYRSSLLEDLWEYGFSTVGEMVPSTIQYVCRYVLKKLQCRGDYGDRMPEFIRMSLKPGIGARFFHDYCGKDFYKKGLDSRWYRDYITCDSLRMKPPRYYDKLFERLHSADFVSLRQNRWEASKDVFAELESDLLRRADYVSTVVKGRITKENFFKDDEKKED